MDDGLTLATFETGVDPDILQRGRDYYAAERVLSLATVDTDAWQAQVAGTTQYDVQVATDDAGELVWWCTCPYDWGPMCKHVVAVLYALREGAPIATAPPTLTGDDRLRAALADLSRDTLQDLLLYLARRDPEVAHHISARYGPPPEDPAEIRQQVQEALYLGTNDHGFIGYQAVMGAVTRLDSVLHLAQRQREAGKPAAALVTYQIMLEETVNALGSADDSSGALGGTVHQVLAALVATRDELDADGRQALFDYLLDQAPERPFRDWDFAWEMLAIAAELVHSDAQQTAYFAALDRMVDQAEYSPAYVRGRVALDKLALLRTRADETAVLAFMEEHIELAEIRLALIDHHLAHEALPAARGLTEAWLADPDALNWRRQQAFLQRLQTIATREGNSDEQRALTERLLLVTGELAYWQALREQVPAPDWAAYRTDVLARLVAAGARPFTLALIYQLEGLWPALLAYVREHPGEVSPFAASLAPHYPDALSDIYEAEVRRLLIHTSDRGVYQEACDLLQKMVALGATERVADVVAFCRREYKRRRALQEELTRVFGRAGA